MDDVKKGYREAEETTKEAWRKSDGEEDLADKLGNAGDDARKELGNLGDEARDTADDAVDEEETFQRQFDRAGAFACFQVRRRGDCTQKIWYREVVPTQKPDTSTPDT